MLLAWLLAVSIGTTPGFGPADKASSCASSRLADDRNGRQVDPWPNVRPATNKLARLLLIGVQRSSTLRALVDALQTKDVIVHVALRTDLGDRIGSLRWVAAAAGRRYLRVGLRSTLAGDALIVALAHELHHAQEVAAAPSVTDRSSLVALYRQIGQRMSAQDDLWETTGAFEAGEHVRQELGRTTGTDAVVFDLKQPIDWFAIYHCLASPTALPPQ